MIFHIETEIKMPLMKLPVRSTFVKFGDKGVLLSPGSRMNERDYSQLENLTDLVATNNFHVGGIRKALKYYPNARVWVPAGAKVDFESDQIKTLGRDIWPYSDEIELIELKGMPKINEFLFFIKETRSLFVTDLFFNLLNTKGVWPMVILSLFGTYKKFGFSRFLNKFIEDKESFRQSITILNNLQISEIVPSHGEILKHEVHAQIVSAFKERGYSI